MKERPILFSGPMVRAILEGRKTQTRRVVKLPAWADPTEGVEFSGLNDGPAVLCRDTGCFADIRCPYGAPGDMIWVRETHSISRLNPSGDVWYWADGNPQSGDWFKPRPSIHMMRNMSRLTLKVTDVRVERLQEISEADAKAEGSYLDRCACMPRGKDRGLMTAFKLQECHIHGMEFSELWRSINGVESWAANPWVWVVSFERQP